MGLKLLVHDRHALGQASEAITVTHRPASQPSLAVLDAPTAQLSQCTAGEASISSEDREGHYNREADRGDDCGAAQNGTMNEIAIDAAIAICRKAAAEADSIEDGSEMEPLLPQSSPRISAMGCGGTRGARSECEHGKLAFWVPFLLSASDIMQGLSAGMTIKFFPIFFMDEVRPPL
jgi:hypothetical protein